MEEFSSIAPLFTIGVTTYDRVGMLKECLDSISGQTCPDFEVIVGNDFPGRTLSAASLGFHDPRFRVVNHERNIGELENMNALVRAGQGRYFCWLADDDLYSPWFLETVRNAIEIHGGPPCVFTAYCQGGQPPERWAPVTRVAEVLSGRVLLEHYLNGRIKTLGCYAAFEMDYLRKIGGMVKLGSGFSPYSETWFLLQAGLLDKVAFVPDPLIFYRTHEQSISWISLDSESYRSGQEALLLRGIPLLKQGPLKKDFDANLSLLLKRLITDFAGVLTRFDRLPWRRWVDYWKMMFRLSGVPSNVRRHMRKMFREKTVMLVKRFSTLWVRRRILGPLVSFKHRDL